MGASKSCIELASPPNPNTCTTKPCSLAVWDVPSSGTGCTGRHSFQGYQTTNNVCQLTLYRRDHGFHQTLLHYKVNLHHVGVIGCPATGVTCASLSGPVSVPVVQPACLCLAADHSLPPAASARCQLPASHQRPCWSWPQPLQPC